MRGRVVGADEGQTKHVTAHLDARSFQYWDEVSQSWKALWGPRTIWVGNANALANLPLSASTTGIALSSSVQYSDPIKATVSPASVDGAPVSGSVEFFVNGVSIGSSPVGAGGVAWSAGVSKAPGSYTASAKFTSSGALKL